MANPQRPRLVLDTNVLVAALRSRNGASFALLAQIGSAAFEHVVTVPLVMEYEEVLHREGLVPMSKADIKAVIDFLCASGLRQAVHFLWRPRLADVRDDMVLEAAVNGACQWLVTHNLRDFSPAAGMGIRVLTPGQALESLKE